MSEELQAATINSVVTLVGVVLGGLIATLTQAWFSWRQQRDARLALGYSVFHKVQRYSDTIGQLCRHITNSKAAATLDDDFWYELEPFNTNERRPAEFTPAELTIFSVANDHAYADDLSNFASLHNVLRQVMRDYSERRAALEARIEAEGDVTIEGDMSVFDPKVLKRYPLQAAKLRVLASHLLRIAQEGYLHNQIIVDSIGAKIREHLKDKRYDLDLLERPQD